MNDKPYIENSANDRAGDFCANRRYRLTVTVECAPEEIIGIKEAIAAGAGLGRSDTICVEELQR